MTETPKHNNNIEKQDFIDWAMKNTPAFNESDTLQVETLLRQYIEEKQCSLDESSALCQSLKVDYKKDRWEWEFIKVRAKSREEKSTISKVTNIWRNSNSMRYVTKQDVYDAIIEWLGNLLKGLTPAQIMADVNQIWGLVFQWLYQKASEKLIEFVIKKVPVTKPLPFAIDVADKVVDKWKSKKNKADKEKQKQKAINNLIKRLVDDIDHLWGDRTGWWHLPKLVERKHNVHYQDTKKIPGSKAEEGLLVVDWVSKWWKSFFPDWGLAEYNAMKLYMVTRFSNDILKIKQSTTMNFNYFWFKVECIIKPVAWKKFKIVTVYPK